jgi:hypothetical protein
MGWTDESCVHYQPEEFWNKLVVKDQNYVSISYKWSRLHRRCMCADAGESCTIFVCQMDADHIPEPGYLRMMLRGFCDPEVDYVSAPSMNDRNMKGDLD